MSDKFYFKVHKHPSEVVIAICDEEILGKTFSGDRMKLTVSEAFYEGNIADADFIRGNIGTFTILNMVGNRIVDLAVEMGIISEDNIIIIGEVKHAQAVRL